MNKHEIALQLKRDIAALVTIAGCWAKNGTDKTTVAVLNSSIMAGLSDYELAWREEVRLQVANTQEEMRGEG